MLTKLMALLRAEPDGLTLAEMSQALGAQPAAVAGMLNWLAHARRLHVVGPDGGYCASCSLMGDCRLLKLKAIRYVIADQAAGDGPMGPRQPDLLL